MRPIRQILNIFDLHVGSQSALWHPDFVGNDGNKYKLNPLQEELYDIYCKIPEDVEEYDTVFLGSDLINGTNRASSGKHQMTTDLNEQMRCVLELLKPLILPGTKVIGISGSNYHGSLDYDIDRAITDYFDGRFYGAFGHFRLKQTSLNFLLTHGTGFPPIYLHTYSSRLAVEYIIGEYMKKYPRIDVHVQGHFHIVDECTRLGKKFVFCPAFELFRNMSHTKNYSKHSDIGVTKIVVYDNDMVIVYPFIYDVKTNFKLESL